MNAYRIIRDQGLRADKGPVEPEVEPVPAAPAHEDVTEVKSDEEDDGDDVENDGGEE
jgi:hypothetical protein